MKARDITILHLSDLHFDAHKEAFYVNSLLSDIQNQIAHSEQLIIVVTGDLAVKSEVRKVETPICKFFEDLHSCIPKTCELLAVEVVPGNHDLTRPLAKNDFHKRTFCNKLAAFDKVSNRIHAIFEDRLISSAERDDGRYGVTYIPYNNQEIALVRLDTSGADIEAELLKDIRDDIASFRRKNIGNTRSKKLPSPKKVLALRQEQVREDIKRQGEEIQQSIYKHDATKRRRRLLTIVMAHHPLTWIKESGVDKIHDTLFKRGLGYTDLWLCGHMHMSQLYYTSENNHQKIMLMSGIGRQDTQHTFMRYSIYSISLERNVCAVQSRGATDGSRFAEDHAMGRASSDDVEHMTVPLRSNQIGAVIRLNNSGKGHLLKDYFVDDNVLGLMKETRERLLWFETNVRSNIDGCAQLVINELAGLNKRGEAALFGYMDWRLERDNSSIDAKAQKIIHDAIIRKRLVRHFLEGICVELYQCVTRPICKFDTAPISDIYLTRVKWDDIRWRFHFRKYQGCAENTYKPELDYYESFVLNDYSQKKPETELQLVPWSGFIKNAFAHNEKCLIQSANQGQNPINTDWDDFLTSVPRFRNSQIEFKTQKIDYEYRPILSFGASIKCETQESLALASRILYALEFLNVNQSIGILIDEFMSEMQITDIRKFLV